MNLKNLYNLLKKEYGKLGKWWPGTSTEILITAILTQNTNWKNVEKAMENIYKFTTKDNLLFFLYDTPKEKLAEIIKPAGFFNIKAERIKNLLNFLKKRNFNLKYVEKEPNLREKLLKIKGIGKETADSILLYAFEFPIFVVDAYTKRLLKRIYGLNIEDYDKIQELFHKNYPKDTRLYQEFHGLIVEHAKKYCRKKPLCSKCFFGKKCNYLTSPLRTY
ncbi:endonuclease [Thermosipho melanesiensis]|uniref:Endonuclease n=1 Tax=Thermosipho melanesiensis TaxID=46541 RepID=A0ABN4UXD8_9BACT|nr:endonuclease [Thermosipho melanesiensis]APT73551.1 endonuclease [Thermosipho melanesiensis]OOC37502.1 endonuclease [Thermosipho melanesiensis]OOC39541.1 endonuclease [Thermosipho melanesiensis]OOC39558.1 endonuclease [Thermosipho melanesiensis]OOC42748.1 endonuclease [Thermosipho melanesiensis]